MHSLIYGLSVKIAATSQFFVGTSHTAPNGDPLAAVEFMQDVGTAAQAPGYVGLSPPSVRASQARTALPWRVFLREDLAFFAEVPLWNGNQLCFEVFASSCGQIRNRFGPAIEKPALRGAKRVAEILKSTLANNAARHLRQPAGQCHRPPG
jgi:hypothetical protein